MGRRRVADPGTRAAACARAGLGITAIGLSGRLFPRFDRLWPAVFLYRLARDVHGRRHSGAAGLLYPAHRAGIAKLEPGASARQYARSRESALAARQLCRAADDRL